MHTFPTGPRAAFTMVELAVVLAIVGLMAGGIMAGRNMMRVSAVKAVQSEAVRYQQAFIQFRNQYRALPGDMINATKYWGIKAGGGSTGSNTACWTVAATGEGTCNGNGDNFIQKPDAITDYEPYLVWQHLANAGLVEGQFSGKIGYKPGTDLPLSKLRGNTYFYYSATSISAGNYFPNYTGASALLLYIGGYPSSHTRVPVLTPQEAANIDSKLDDGNPAYGKLLAPISTNTQTPNCTTGTTAATGAYNVSKNGTLCVLTWFNPQNG